jgi:SAM-dependent methyltransferase
MIPIAYSVLFGYFFQPNPRPLRLASFGGAAHHLEDVEQVRAVLRQMDRITRPEGLVMLSDPVRLRTAVLTERFVDLIAGDYAARGLSVFQDDFRHTMYAAFTPRGLRRAIPRDTTRIWFHLIPFGLPGFQTLIGVPERREALWLRGGLPWEPGSNPVPQDARGEWGFLRLSLRLGSIRCLSHP